MRIDHRYLWILGLLGLLASQSSLSCAPPKAREAKRAIYHWQSRFQLTSEEHDFLDQAKVSKLYLRFFDVDRASTADLILPLAELQYRDSLPSDMEIVPTVFITNRSLRQISVAELDSLGVRIVRKIRQLWKGVKNHSLREIQIDCDWSGQTREAYFQLLRQLQQQLSPDRIRLSVTIRLHQLKYPRRTGVPPVDRGMLMFYNMGDLESPETLNSILDTTIARQYLLPNLKPYPLALDFVLPIFSWGVLFRDDRMIKLINNLNAERLDHDERFEKITQNEYRLRQSTYLDGYYLYEDDRIRCERVHFSALQVAAKMLQPVINTNKFTLAFYHLDKATLENYTYEELETLYHHFEAVDP